MGAGGALLGNKLSPASLPDLLRNAYPDHQWNDWRFNEPHWYRGD
jgi:hypothetical protein